jgi:hypothetical protein
VKTSEPEEQLIAKIRVYQKNLSAEARKALWDKITEGYCKDCAYQSPIGGCYCEDDE